MPKDLRVTILQTNLIWEDAVKNIRNINKQLSKLKRNSTDVIVLPEMFNTGFTMNVSNVAETSGGLTMQWMTEVAASLNTVVCGSIIIKEKTKFYNRLIWMNADGTHEYYDKRHLFRMGGEDKVFTSGKESILIEYKGWRICPLVCYDLRFPVWSRNRIEHSGKDISFDYDLLLYVANWPAARSFAWEHLLVARAIENQSYLVAVNRIGTDGNDHAYNGNSVVLDPFGKKINTSKAEKQFLETTILSMKNLTDTRKRFPVFFDADGFKVL